MIDGEVPLEGGNVNKNVVRIGNTVRRTVTENSQNVHRLLQHLENQKFLYSPRILGIDAQNREILSYMEGTTSFPADMWTSKNALIQSASILRQFHDSQLGIDNANKQWAYIFEGDYKNDVICHNDFAPYNMIFNDGMPTAIIDFDLSGPGPRLRDLAYLAYWMVPLSFTKGEMSKPSYDDMNCGSKRLKLICSAYGTNDYRQLIDLISLVLDHMSNQGAVSQMVGEVTANELERGGHFHHWQEEATAFAECRKQIEANLLV